MSDSYNYRVTEFQILFNMLKINIMDYIFQGPSTCVIYFCPEMWNGGMSRLQDGAEIYRLHEADTD